MRYLLLIVGILGLAGCVARQGTSAHQQASTAGQQCDAGQRETPSNRFQIDEAAGTVLDTKTNLTWKRCSEGQIYKAGHCLGESSRWAWAEAVTQFGVDGESWRLPSVDELVSIIETKCSNPAINMTVFPDAPSDWFWSASPYSLSSGSAWYISFYRGEVDGSYKSGNRNIFLVRGAKWTNHSGILEADRRHEMARNAKDAKDASEKELKRLQVEEGKRRKEEEKRSKEAEERRKIAELLEAEKSAAFFCPDKANCDKAFSLTQIYLNQTADMKIQVATDTIVETYNPTEDGKLGLKATRIPGKGTSARIVLTAICKNEKGFYAETCRLVKLRAYQGFRPFIE